MRIQELEKKTGLDRATIRFYEKESLLQPERSENGYRQYSDRDAEHLMKIKLLRQLGMSLEQIKGLQQGSGELSLQLDLQIKVLSAQVESKRQAIDVCKELLSGGASYESLDAAKYLSYLEAGKADTAGRTAPPKAIPFYEPIRREVHPVRRYAARVLDINLFSVLIHIALFLILRLRPVPTGIAGNLLSWGIWLLWLPLEALLLSTAGTTPGKWLMGIRLEFVEGGRLTFSQAADRAWRVFGRGMGYGIPVYNLWRAYKSYQSHVTEGDMEWDDHSEVIYAPQRLGRTTLAAISIVLIFGVNVWVATDSVLPGNRSDGLTIAEFAENYNFYQQILYGKTNEKMRSDGMIDYPETQYGVVIYIDGEPENKKPQFDIETEKGYITRITYQNSWTNAFALKPLSGNETAAAMAAALGQRGMQFTDFSEYQKVWEAAICEQNGQLEFGDVIIRWTVSGDGFESHNGMYFSQEGGEISTLTLKYEILFQ